MRCPSLSHTHRYKIYTHAYMQICTYTRTSADTHKIHTRTYLRTLMQIHTHSGFTATFDSATLSYMCDDAAGKLAYPLRLIQVSWSVQMSSNPTSSDKKMHVQVCLFMREFVSYEKKLFCL